MQLFLNRKRKYTATLWRYMLVVVTILLLLSVIISYYFCESSMNNIREKNMLSIKLLKKDIDSQIKFMNETTQTLKNDYELLLAIMEDNGYSDYKLATKLVGYTTINPYIIDIAIFDYRMNKAYCSSGMIEADRYFDFYVRSTVNSAELNRQISMTNSSTLKGFFQAKVHKHFDTQDIALYITPISSTRKLVYIIHRDVFVKPVEAIIGNLQGTFHILDSSYNSLLSYTINSDKEFEIDFNDYIPEESIEEIFLDQRGSNMLATSDSAVSSFKYCIVSDPSLFIRELKVAQTVLVISLVGLVVIGIISIYVFANISYRPITLLKDYIINLPEAKGTTGYDDLDIIKDHMYEIHERLRTASQRLLSDKDFLWNSLVNALVSSTSAYYTNHDNYEREGIFFPYELFAALVINSADKTIFHQFRRWEDKDNKAIGYISDKNEYGVVIGLFNAYDEAALKRTTESFCMSAQLLDKSCTIGIGDSARGTHKIRQSFTQALSALNKADNENKICRYDPSIQTVVHQFDYVNSIKARLSHAIRVSDIAEVEALVRDAFQSTSDHTQHILIYSDLISQLIMIAYSLNFYDDEMNNALYYIYSDQQSMINGYLIFARELCQYIEKTKSNKSTQLLKEVQSYINENFADKNLSVQSISEHFNVSVSYLNKYMKEVGSETVFSMLDSVRMKHAKQMLLEGDAPLKEIVDRCGYGDTSHFIKKFRKQTGLTPTQYRTCHDYTAAYSLSSVE